MESKALSFDSMLARACSASSFLVFIALPIVATSFVGLPLLDWATALLLCKESSLSDTFFAVLFSESN